MSAYEVKIYGIVLAMLLIILLCSAIWLASILLREAEEIKNAAKSVGSAFAFVDVEITKKLKNNNAIHFYDIMSIVGKVASIVPGVKVTVDKAFERNQVSIVIEKGELKATYTLLATIVEAPYQQHQSKQI